MKQPKTESIWTRFLRVLASFASDQGRDRATVAICAVKCGWRAFDAHQFGISKTQC